MKKVLIYGATSSIASHCARLWVKEECELLLVGRDKEKLKQTAADLKARGARAVYEITSDLSDLSKHKSLVEKSFKTLGTVDTVLVAHGSLPDQQDCERDVTTAVNEFILNGLSVMSLLTLISNKMEAQGYGEIAVISSVAGDRGRPSNYLYGSAKAAVTTFTEGLRGRLHSKGVGVTTIKPGFVNTPMTANLKLPGPLVASPQKVANDILKAVKAKQSTLYTPHYWRWIMLIIKSIPSFIFRKLSI